MNDNEHSETILVVDDTPANLSLLSGMLTSAGYRVKPAPNGRLALRAAKNDPPDLILLDINMPEMNGFDVCRELKGDKLLDSIPVLFISALTDTQDKIKAFESGGLDYITKPFQAAEVLARVKTHLEIKRYQTALKEKSQSLQMALDNLKSAQDQLIQSEKMASLGVLTAGIAHEINNPINFIKTSAQGLGQDMDDIRELLDTYDQCSQTCADSTLKEQIAVIKSNVDYDVLRDELPKLMDNITLGVERTEEIVNSLRTYSRPDEQKMVPVVLDEIIETALVLLKNRHNKIVEITKAFTEVPEVLGQPGRLVQVFSNVIGNAIDAVTDGRQEAAPAIDIRTYAEVRDGIEFAVVRIRDNGPGMSKDQIASIFDPFYTTKEIGKGVGLGMSISYGIVRDHKGYIDVSSGDECGATVTIYLPFNREES